MAHLSDLVGDIAGDPTDQGGGLLVTAKRGRSLAARLPRMRALRGKVYLRTMRYLHGRVRDCFGHLTDFSFHGLISTRTKKQCVTCSYEAETTLYVHVALFNVFDSLVDVFGDFFPHSDSQVFLQFGASSHFRCEDGTQRGDLVLDLGQLFAP